ncbi:rna-directed dna polymerase from mobile element jockey-like [Pitangus sulphuratus]|nr:rna-directed dna polymerase from mobile element jockey-like [Pitangus sulphuratus]
MKDKKRMRITLQIYEGKIMSYLPAEHTLGKFADDTKQGAVADTPECHAFQRDLDKLEKGANRNLMKFNKSKCQILHLGRNNPRYQYKLGANYLESSIAQKAKGVLRGKELDMNQQCTLAGKNAKILLGCLASRLKEVIFTSAQH